MNTRLVKTCDKFEERAAIMQFDGKKERNKAEQLALKYVCWNCPTQCEKREQLQPSLLDV